VAELGQARSRRRSRVHSEGMSLTLRASVARLDILIEARAVSGPWQTQCAAPSRRAVFCKAPARTTRAHRCRKATLLHLRVLLLPGSRTSRCRIEAVVHRRGYAAFDIRRPEALSCRTGCRTPSLSTAIPLSYGGGSSGRRDFDFGHDVTVRPRRGVYFAVTKRDVQ
jgi:hypothetical protein